MSKDNKVEDWDENYSETQPDEVEENNLGNEESENVRKIEVDELSVEEELREDLAKEKDKFLRLFAEFENYKKRTAKERMDLFRTAGQDVIASLLPVLDDFDRAMKELAQSGDEAHFKGVELIKIKFQEILKSKGLQEIEVKQGDAFDAEVHDAITQIPAPEKKLKGKVVDVIQKGFSLGDKIIRHPQVVVGN